MSYQIVSRPTGDRHDEIVAGLWQCNYICSLAIRVFEENGEELGDKVDFPFMMDMLRAIGLRMHELAAIPYCARCLDVPGVVVVYHFLPRVFFPVNLFCVNFDLVADQNPEQNYKCSVSYVIKWDER
jgi:hypothetical protein